MSGNGNFDRAALLALCAASFFSLMSMRLCDPLLPAFSDQFGISIGQAALSVSSFAIAYGLLQLAFGPMGDRYGKFRVIACAVTACTVGNAVAAASQDWTLLVVARTLAGATAAGIVPLTLAWVGDAVDYERRQEVLSYVMSATVIGIAGGQWTAGLMAETVGWRWAFVLLAIAFALLGGGMLRMSARRPHVVQAERQTFVQGMRSVLALRWARWILALTLVEGALAFAIMTFIPAYLYSRFGLSLKVAAAVAMLFALGGLLYASQARRLVAALGETGLSAGGALLLGAGLLALLYLPAWQWAPPVCLLAGMGFTMLHATLQTHATQMAPATRGTATALFGACIFLGQSLGIAIMAAIIDGHGYAPVFLGCAGVVAALGIVFAISVRRRERASPMAVEEAS